jgi:hypothetical protein
MIGETKKQREPKTTTTTRKTLSDKEFERVKSKMEDICEDYLAIFGHGEIAPRREDAEAQRLRREFGE